MSPTELSLRERERARQRESYARHAEKRRASKLAYIAKNRDLINQRRRESRKKSGPDTDYLTRRYGLTIDQYRVLLDRQGGKCAICGGNENGRRFAVDHCHDTGRIRGLLCMKCNTGIGKLRDSVDLLRKAIAYLESK
jgi:hypothetical protein